MLGATHGGDQFTIRSAPSVGSNVIRCHPTDIAIPLVLFDSHVVILIKADFPALNIK